MIEIKIDGRPVSKGNSGRIVKRGKRMSFMPSRQAVAAQATSAEQVRAQYAGPVLTGPLRVDAVFIYAVPKRNPNKVEPGSFCLRKVDRGNLLKLIEDAMSGIVYVDDSQIVCGDVRKVWGTENATIVRVSPAS